MTMLLRLNRIYRSRKLQASNFMAKLQESLPQDFSVVIPMVKISLTESTLSILVEGFEMTDH
jgi:hypothetical protein